VFVDPMLHLQRQQLLAHDIWMRRKRRQPAGASLEMLGADSWFLA